MFPVRAQKLYEFYKAYDSLELIPAAERTKLEAQVFRKPLETIWQETEAFFRERDPEQLERANQNPKRKMALVSRWYLGLSSRWSNSSEAGREMDYQIWCGPAMGAYNEWTQDTYLAMPQNRRAPEVAEQLMHGAAYLYRLQHLRAQGVNLPASLAVYKPEPIASLMHYPSTAFSKNGRATITRVDKQPLSWNRSHPSTTDIATLNAYMRDTYSPWPSLSPAQCSTSTR